MNPRTIPSLSRAARSVGAVFGALPSAWIERLRAHPWVALIIRVQIIVPNRWLLWRVNRSFRDLAKTQTSVLLSILRRQQSTEYAMQHGFGLIHSIEDYRYRVPVNDFENLRPWIERQDKTGIPALNATMPVYYASTSGTTGKPKYIPVLRRTLKAHRRIQNLGVYHLWKTLPRLEQGRVLAIASPAVEGYMEGSGLPVGATSGRIYEEIPAIAKAIKYVLPVQVFSIGDYDLRYLTILRIALECADISSVMTANPSTLCLLGKYINEYFDRLVDDIEHGGFHALDDLDLAQRRTVKARLGANPDRARELRAIRDAAENRTVRLKDIWPGLQCVGCWTGGNSSIFVDRLKLELAPDTLIWDIGYLASEARLTVPIPGPGAAGLPVFWHIYFEFVKCDDWGMDEARFLGLHELADGQQYYIFITTDAGLYRYNMHDLVEVDGFFKGVPLLRFVQKGKGITSITGEKLFESQIISTVEAVSGRFDIRVDFYMMAADEYGCYYHLYFEPGAHRLEKVLDRITDLAHAMDGALQEINCEYAAKRKSGRLKPMVLSILRQGTYEQYKKARVNSGQREGQFKIIALLYKKDIGFDFSPHTITESGEGGQQIRFGGR